MAVATALAALALLRPNTLRTGPRAALDSVSGVLVRAADTIVDQIVAARVLGAIVVIYGLLSRAGNAPRFLAVAKRAFKRLEFQWYRRLDP